MHESSFFATIGKIVAGKTSKWITLLVWIALLVVMTIVFPAITKEENNNAALLPKTSQSVIASQKLHQDFPHNSGQPALIVFDNAEGLSTSTYTKIQSFAASLVKHPLPYQKSVVPYQSMPTFVLRSMASKDHQSFMMPITFQSGIRADRLRPVMQTLQTRLINTFGSSAVHSSVTSTGLHLRITGPVGIATDALGLFGNLDVTLLAATSMLVLVLLILLYRSPILAIIPLISVGFAYGAISPLLGILAKSGVITVDTQGVSIMTVLLFGAGTDYCLFLVARYRELLGVETDKHRAMQGAMKGAAGAIAMSGLTVVISLLALLFSHYGTDQRFAIPFSLSILVMGLAGITLVPALLAILGRLSFFPFIPRTEAMLSSRKNGKKFVQQDVGRLAAWNGKIVTTRPWAVLLITVIVLGSFALFSSQIKPTYDLMSSFPKTMASREGYSLLADHYGKGSLAPVQLLMTLPTAKNTSVLHQVETSLSSLPFVQNVASPSLSTVNHHAIVINITLNENPYSLKAMADLHQIRLTIATTLRNDKIAVHTNTILLAGVTATQADTQAVTHHDTMTVIPIVIGIIAILLLLYLRSLVAMLYLMGTVLLSFFSALGVGWLLLHNMMGYSAIAGGTQLYAFVFLVALGEDYNIFMISRIWQATKTKGIKEAVSLGVSKTSGVITSAGLILAGTFAVLTAMPIQILVQFGIITATGVLIDTFIVRPFLVPAITVLLGKYAFWPNNFAKNQESHAREGGPTLLIDQE